MLWGVFVLKKNNKIENGIVNELIIIRFGIVLLLLNKYVYVRSKKYVMINIKKIWENI